MCMILNASAGGVAYAASDTRVWTHGTVQNPLDTPEYRDLGGRLLKASRFWFTASGSGAVIHALQDALMQIDVASSKEMSALLAKLYAAFLEEAASRFALPLGAAAATDNLELARLLLDRGATVDGPNSALQEAVTPIYLAAAQGSVEMVSLLLDHGADPNGGFGRNQGFGPLYGAVLGERVEIVRLLLAVGADPAGAIPGGLDIRMFTQNEEIINLLSR